MPTGPRQTSNPKREEADRDALAAAELLANPLLQKVLVAMRENIVEALEVTQHDGSEKSLSVQMELTRTLRNLRNFRIGLSGMIKGKVNRDKFTELMLENKGRLDDDPLGENQ